MADFSRLQGAGSHREKLLTPKGKDFTLAGPKRKIQPLSLSVLMLQKTEVNMSKAEPNEHFPHPYRVSALEASYLYCSYIYIFTGYYENGKNTSIQKLRMGGLEE